MDPLKLTYFAPAQRKQPAEILRENQRIKNISFLQQIIESLSIAVVVLNSQRQIVFSNGVFLNLVGADMASLLGKRPGEALGCKHSTDTMHGCGTSETCATCGAVQAIVECLSRNVKSVRECRVTSSAGNGTSLSYDLLVTANPFEFEGSTFAIVSMDDISHLKRRRLLEQIFFHDIINSASGLRALVECIKISQPDKISEIMPHLDRQSTTIIDEILAQKQILEAETGELKLQLNPVHAREISEAVVGIMAFNPLAQDKKISIDPLSKDFEINSDFGLLKRILLNMLKNAVESSGDLATITLGFSYLDDGCVFEVRNPDVIPREIQLQLFQRSFSTKGAGRGLGTYSMKLLGEKYLKGAVGFESTEENGTKFFIKLPARL
jgi:nitrogen fixation/metabolism regulation signal transduction histidine kinase